MEFNNDLDGFIKNQESYNDFRKYIENLLKSFIPDEYVKICMAERLDPKVQRTHVLKTFKTAETAVAGLNERNRVEVGPFAIIRRAFTHSFFNEMNLESLETLGDGVLNETVAMIIVGNWPNLLSSAGHVANMKKFYTNNTELGKYSERLGFLRWLVRIPGQGLGTKERGDIFESFVGALVLIGEFYIGDQMGLAMARLFLNQFFKTVDWFPENREYYEAPENLYNDWKNSLPENQRPKFSVKITQIDEFQHVTLKIEDSVENGPIFQKSGKSKHVFRAKARSSDDAKSQVFIQLRNTLDIKRKDIFEQRRLKQFKIPEIKEIIDALEKHSNGRRLRLTGKDIRGGKIFVFIEETVTARVGGKTLEYDVTLVSASVPNDGNIRDAEIKASKIALEKFIAGDTHNIMPGIDLDFSNPDEDVIPFTSGRPKYESKAANEQKKTQDPTQGPQKGRGRGFSSNTETPVGRGRGSPTVKAFPTNLLVVAGLKEIPD